MSGELLCQAPRSQLLVIDVQEKLTNAMPEQHVRTMLQNIGTLLQASKQLHIPVLHSEQYPQGLGPTHAQLTPLLSHEAVSKTCFSCCSAPSPRLTDAMQHKHQWILIGVETHICVTQTCMELLARGKQVFVVEDAVCSRTKSNFKNGIKRMRQAGAVITNTESVLFEWLRDAQHEHFRELSRLIR